MYIVNLLAIQNAPVNICLPGDVRIEEKRFDREEYGERQWPIS
jgi:hypothetical protein